MPGPFGLIIMSCYNMNSHKPVEITCMVQHLLGYYCPIPCSTFISTPKVQKTALLYLECILDMSINAHQL